MEMSEEIMPTHVHDTGVNVAKLLEAEQPRSVSRVIEGEALRCSVNFGSIPNCQTRTYSSSVDGDGSSIGRRIG